ncbi:MAG: DUF929 family protein [Elusimicrobia bacterium]|nr:DUF929 family protein [Elusimicrobiota bacterium]
MGRFIEAGTETLRRNGKLYVYFMSAGYCPYCAGERWAIVRALERFGRWSGLKESSSASRDEPWLDLPTYDFASAAYGSEHVEFAACETDDREFRPLQKPAQADAPLVRKFDPKGYIPFLLIGGRFTQVGSGVKLSLLAGLSFSQAQAQAQDRATSLGQAVETEANVICALACLAGLPLQLFREPEIAGLVEQAQSVLVHGTPAP